MIITNKYKLPQAFVNMAQQEYELLPNQYRVTSLLRGVKETMLLRRHDHEITVDVADMILMLFGTAVHHFLEHQDPCDNEEREIRLNIPVIDKYILSGQFDIYNKEEKCIEDYKTASVWKIIHKDYDDWKKQIFIYAMMAREHGYDVEFGRVIPMLKDFSPAKQRYDSSYPVKPVYPVKFKVTKDNMDWASNYVTQKLTEIDNCVNIADDDITPCTMEERWGSADTYAVMKEGVQRARRVLETEEEAFEYIINSKEGNKLYVDARKGEDKKCLYYCYAKDYCNHYHKFWSNKKEVS